MEIIMFNKTKEELISFEKRIVKLFEEGKIPYLLHLCGGNEDELIKIFSFINEGDYVLSTHRSHYHYLLAGGSESELEKKILDGNSMFVFDKKLNFLTSSILSGMTSIAVGIAYSLKIENSKRKVWCFVGDGAEDEGHIYEAIRFVDSQDLPCQFIIEDNDRSVNSSKEMRYGKCVNFIWNSKHVYKYEYKPTYPHAGTGSGKMVNLDKYIKY